MTKIKNKPLIIGLGSLTPFVLYYFTDSIADITHFRYGHELDDLQDLKHSIPWAFLTWYWTNGFEKVRPPRLKNFLETSKISLKGLFINKTQKPEEWLKLNLRLNEITYREPQVTELQLCNYHISQRDFESAIEHLQKGLEIYSPSQNNFFWEQIHKLSQPLVNLMFQKPTLENLLEKATFEIQRKNYNAFNEIFEQALSLYPSEETELIHAMLLSTANLTQTNKIWKQILDKHSNEFEKVGQSRNLVREISKGIHKSVIFIKSGKDLETEYKILRQIYDQLPAEERISVMPLAFLKENELQCLITLRRASPNIDSILAQSSEEERIQIANQALTNLHKFHKLKLEGLEEYNPLEVLRQRLIRRFPNSNPEILLSTYERFLNKFRYEQSPIHGDAYPTNFLKDGRILDLEKCSLGNPWLDLETFTTNPLLIPYQEKLLRDLNQQSRELFAVHVPLCQIGSFHSKPDPTTAMYFFNLAIDRLQALEERELLTAVKDYLQPVIFS